MNYITLIGLAAAALTTTSFIPQLIKSWKARSAKDLSLGMFVIFGSGVFLWLIYGILINDAPVIISNAITLVLALTILALKLKHG
ncbi:SemiSWEET family sugar transporter [bacterium]|nr:MAG: hypothetical protein EDS67_15815 [candidate division KSB1 bacterium]MCE7942570.1 hypothetical protein [Chlorobi bacterium CHB1]MCL4709581.1 SemiSWEET family sugar transporter [bacterium]MDL1875499.1 hypothetical protein [Cytophagia bacterium CHB2]MBC6947755.1 hypothetical protein [candidate division KSB1 bacterium]